LKKIRINEIPVVVALNIPGTTQIQIAKLLGISDWSVDRIKVKYGIGLTHYGRKCVNCGKIMVTKVKHQNKCHECGKLGDLYYGEIHLIRREYSKMAYRDRNKANQLREEMIEKEGLAFTEMALNGILDKVENGYMSKGKTKSADGYRLLEGKYHGACIRCDLPKADRGLIDYAREILYKDIKMYCLEYNRITYEYRKDIIYFITGAEDVVKKLIIENDYNVERFERFLMESREIQTV
jgi:DNA-directed RNA polymerase subunit M/transcription elongation factor TFIIS